MFCSTPVYQSVLASHSLCLNYSGLDSFRVGFLYWLGGDTSLESCCSGLFGLCRVRELMGVTAESRIYKLE